MNCALKGKQKKSTKTTPRFPKEDALWKRVTKIPLGKMNQWVYDGFCNYHKNLGVDFVKARPIY
jgi:hypothetical protein